MLHKRFFLIALFTLSCLGANAQFTLGFKVSPTLATNRIKAESDTLSFSTNGTGLRVVLGPIADIQFRENYFFSTGILLVSKRSSYEINNLNQETTSRETYGLQYLQIPLSLKLFTNEIALDKKVYFHFGTTLDFKISENSKSEDNELVTDFFFFDSTLFLGAGLESKLGVNTRVFTGIAYNRGLINAVRNTQRLDGDVNSKNDFLSLELGIKF